MVPITIVLAATLLSLLPGPAFAQSDHLPAAQPVSAPEALPRASLDPPAPEASMRAFRAVSGWVRLWSVPASLSPEESRALALPVPSAACVTLRFAGEVVGRGEAIAGPTSAAQGEGPDVILQAARAALEAAELKLPLQRTRDLPEQARKLAPEITISLELAGAFTPIEPGTWADAELSLAPGLDGVSVTPAQSRPGIKPQIMFPSQMLLTNLLPHRAMAALAAQSIGEGGAAAVLEEPKLVREKHALRFSRFRVTHLAQPSPGTEPVFMFRGQRIISSQRAMSRAELEAMARALVAHLNLRTQRPPSSAAGDWQEEHSRVLALLATQAASRMLAARDGTGAEEPSSIDRLLLPPDAARIRVLPNWKSESTAALSLLTAVHAGYGLPRASADTDRVGSISLERTLAAFDAIKPDAAKPDASRPQRVLMLSALAQTAAIPGGPEAWQKLWFRADPSRLRQVVSSVFASAEPGQLVSDMPWLGWAALAASQQGDVIGAAPLRDMRAALWVHQCGVSTATPDTQDLLGGIAFTKGLAEGKAAALPTWQCARPLAFVATMLRDPRLTEPQERSAELVKLLAALRFLRQLQVDDASAWLYAEPAKAVGGIRASVWDSALPLDASSMTLLCVTEALRSLNELAKPAPAPRDDHPPPNP